MGLFDIIGPVMVGPSSSHTAGAVRIGYICNKLMKEPIQKATILLYGSFLATGKGHGTDKALIAGLIGMKPEDERIPLSFEIAQKEGLEFHFGSTDFMNAHPNTVKLRVSGKSGRTLEMVAASIGGGRVRVCQIDGLEANFCGDRPTLIVHNVDEPGRVTEVTGILAEKSINIATLQLYRGDRGGVAVMVIECDQEIPEESIERLENMNGIIKVTYLSLK